MTDPYPRQETGPNQEYYGWQSGTQIPSPPRPGAYAGVPTNPHASYGQQHGYNNQSDMYATSFPEDPELKHFEFTDKSIRRGFIRKVYAILMFQLLVTAAVISGIYFSPKATNFVLENPWLFFMALIILFVSMIALACCGEMRRKSPVNYILLILFTVAESFMMAIATTAYDVESLLMAVGIASALCLGLTLFAFQTKWDFTVCGGFLFVCVYMLLIFGLIISIFFMTGSYSTARTLNLVYASLGAVLFSLYLIFDTQLMLGGKHKYSISPEEYIFAALNLYVDIISIFMYILIIVGLKK